MPPPKTLLLLLLLFSLLFPTDVKAQLSAAAIKQWIVQGTQEGKAHTTSRLKVLDKSLSDIIKKGIQQISTGQDKQIAILEIIANANATRQTMQINEGIERQAILDHTPMEGACLAPTAGNAIGQSETKIALYKDTIKKVMRPWNEPEGRRNKSTVESIKILGARMEKIAGDNPISESIDPGLFIANKTYQKEDLDKAEVNIRLLTDPKPVTLPIPDGDPANNLAWAAAVHDRAKSQLSQDILGGMLARRMPSTDLAQWHKTVTGETGEGPTSWIQSIVGEGGRRFKSVQWYAGLQEASGQEINREIARMLAFQNYMMVQIFLEAEKGNLLGASQLRNNASTSGGSWTANKGVKNK